MRKPLLLALGLAATLIGPYAHARAVRHIVVFKFTEDATQAQIDKVTTAFSELPSKIPGILAFEHGVNNSPEALNKGFSHVYQVTFKDSAARDAYLPHPAHKQFGELLGELGILDDVFVVDYNKPK